MKNYIADMIGDLSPGVRRFIATESLFGLGAGMLALILNLHLLALGFNEEEIGKVTSVGALAMGFLSLPAGLLVRKAGRKKMLVLGMALLALGLAGFAFGTSKLDVMASQLAWSVGMTAVVTSEIQLIFQYCRDKKEETRAYSLLFAVFTLFTGAGTLLGGFLPKWLGGSSTVYQYTFLAAAGCLGLAAVLRGLLLPSQATKIPKAENTAVQAHETHGAGAGNKVPLFVLCVIIFLSGALFGLLNPYLNVILKGRFGWEDGAISMLLTVSGVFLFFGSLLVPYLLEKLGLRKAFAVLFAGNALLAFLMGLTVPAAVFSVLLLFRGGLFTMLSNVIDSEAMSAVPENDRNLFAGLRTIARSSGNSLASYAAGWMLSTSDYSLPFLVTGCLLVLGYGLYVWTAQPILEKRRRSRFT
ncbi:MFS transporter [Cohnella pontilimi]|nr:MFS transporter [Cohnella pontilimi]